MTRVLLFIFSFDSKQLLGCVSLHGCVLSTELCGNCWSCSHLDGSTEGLALGGGDGGAFDFGELSVCRCVGTQVRLGGDEENCSLGAKVPQLGNPLLGHVEVAVRVGNTETRDKARSNFASFGCVQKHRWWC